MDSSLLLSVIGATLSVMVLGFIVAEGVVSRRAVNRSLRQITWDDPAITRLRDRELAAPASRRVLVPGLRRVSDFGRRFVPTSALDRLDEELVFAGAPPAWTGERVLAVKLLASAGLAVLGLVVSILAGVGPAWTIVIVPAGGFVGYYLPEWVLRNRSGLRQEHIRRSLPDALDLLSITVEAGLGFDAALDRVAREIRGPLGGEFYRVVQEMRLGKGRSDALRDLGERSNVAELRSFTLAMVQADIFGISIANVLHVQANELRIKRRQRAEQEAYKLPVKIIFPLVLCIFPSLFVILLGPAVLRIYENLQL